MKMTKLTCRLMILSVGIGLLFGLARLVAADPPAPLSQEDVQMLHKLKAVANRSTEGLVVVTHPNGARSVDLQGRFQELLLGRVRPEDGVLETISAGSFKQALRYLSLDPAQVEAALAQEPPRPHEAAGSITGQTYTIQGSQGTTLILIVVDGPGEGFNDPTLATPVGGNTGTTLGQQRLIAFQAAAAIWAEALDSTVPIRIEAGFEPMFCQEEEEAILGFAGPLVVNADFTGADYFDTWYPGALANKLSGFDLEPEYDDIWARFNNLVDEACLGPGTNWYYGLDHQPPPGHPNLLETLLHELGHGLGFINFVDEETGENFLGSPDIFSYFTFDTTLGAYWSDFPPDPEGDSLRQVSAINTNNLVWDGPNVRAEAPDYLTDYVPHLLINQPDNIARSYVAVPAYFGAPITESTHITRDIVRVKDGTPPISDGCQPITNGAALTGKLALIDRGLCNLIDKVANAQKAGAIGAIVVNNVFGPPFAMTGDDPTITIPGVMVSLESGSIIKAAFEQGNVNGTLELDTSSIAGMDSLGRVRLYAPNPVEPGSSAGHWDTTASPHLLMEPFQESGLAQAQPLDLTPALLKDIGWSSSTPIHIYLPVLFKKASSDP